MQEMVIYGVSFDLGSKQPIVLLKTADGNRFLPIWIGHPEAAAILMKLQGASTPRPMTHDLVADMLEQLDAQVDPHHRHRAQGEHVLRVDHGSAERLRGRDRLAAVRRDRARRPGRGADLRRRRRDRGVGDRVRGRRGERGGDRSTSSSASSTMSPRTSSRSAKKSPEPVASSRCKSSRRSSSRRRGSGPPRSACGTQPWEAGYVGTDG